MFASYLKEKREQRGLSQAALARRSGLDHSIISRWEAGTRTPTRESVDLIATALYLDAHDRGLLFSAAGFSVDGELAMVHPLLRNLNRALIEAEPDLLPEIRTQVEVLAGLLQQAVEGAVRHEDV
jgi:transcriptional regulator with XRE-family HTH domain